ncbi:predicted protein [Pyrenophora tritici-repentis Pt-1C-BFP]|uniref:Uncharacterized protein n=1 Tax=Pyrenophora tritici-repentis (strain Pt-1C-BFP) TaxID=426418 RepID=B2WAG2_PYRTR|nr:uncharacterized protein PTRG_07275 [Pyrenophora tritici-repentis Pt-1C-BFP]EDU50194.1 predicted protein [Pyrenophora tritici-repentis Pt-1C-BFP]
MALRLVRRQFEQMTNEGCMSFAVCMQIAACQRWVDVRQRPHTYAQASSTIDTGLTLMRNLIAVL